MHLPNKIIMHERFHLPLQFKYAGFALRVIEEYAQLTASFNDCHGSAVLHHINELM